MKSHTQLVFLLLYYPIFCCCCFKVPFLFETMRLDSPTKEYLVCCINLCGTFWQMAKQWLFDSSSYFVQFLMDGVLCVTHTLFFFFFIN